MTSSSGGSMPGYRESREELAAQELDRRRAKKSFVYFVKNFCMIWVKEGGDPIPFDLWPFQEDAANKFQHKQKLIILKARQMGFSWLAMCYIIWKVLHKANFHVYVTSIGLKEVSEQMERIRFIWYNIPHHVKGGIELGGKNCKDNDSLIEFTNGSAIHAVASSKGGGHGAAPGLYVLDELARKENDKVAWRAIKPSLGRNSEVIIISTSNGMNNLYAELWFDASAGGNGFTPIFYSCHDHPEYTEDYLAEQKRDFAGDLEGYKQAFPETPEDAFMASSRSVFDVERIREWKEYIRAEGIKFDIGRLEEEEDGVGFVEDETGSLLIFKHPVPDRMYTMGVDLAEGLVHGDYSVSAVLDGETNEVSALFRAKISPELYSYPVLCLGKYYNNAWIAIEVNKNADVIVNDLKMQYPWLYTRMVREKITDKGTATVGFVTSSTSKPRVIMQLRRLFSDTDNPLKIYSDIILDEMAAYEESKTGSLGAAQGYHDDCVMAVALAVEAKSTMPSQRPHVGRGHEDGGMFGKRSRHSWRSF